MKTNFELTVERLASAPHKVAGLTQLPLFTSETASTVPAKAGALLKDIFGATVKDSTGLNKVLQTAGGSALGAAIVGLGSFAFNKAKDGLFGSQDAEKARHVEEGKLQAQNQFKAHSIGILGPKHDHVLSVVMKDEIISKADKELMHSAYNTMKRFAPNLAADENAAKSFLREHAIYGNGPSYAALKNLADAEQAVARAGGVVG